MYMGRMIRSSVGQMWKRIGITELCDSGMRLVLHRGLAQCSAQTVWEVYMGTFLTHISIFLISVFHFLDIPLYSVSLVNSFFSGSNSSIYHTSIGYRYKDMCNFSPRSFSLLSVCLLFLK